MQYLLHLSKEHDSLPVAEAVALLKVKKPRQHDNFLIFSYNDKKKIVSLAPRLAYSRGLYEFLFESSAKKLIDAMRSFPWDHVYKKSFCVRLHSHPEKYSEREVAGIIWSQLKKPAVDLENPVCHFDFFFVGDRVLVARQIQLINPLHKPKLLNHPTSLDSKLARAIINLTGIEKGQLYDPFCGVGGVLIEAGLMGLEPIGTDINEVLVSAAIKNLKGFKIKSFKVSHGDATKLHKKIAYLATDPPYGKNTSTKDIDSLYDSFLKVLKKNMTNRAVVVFPHWSKYHTLLKKHKLKVVGEYSCYVHHSMTRKVVVITA